MDARLRKDPPRARASRQRCPTVYMHVLLLSHISIVFMLVAADSSHIATCRRSTRTMVITLFYSHDSPTFPRIIWRDIGQCITSLNVPVKFIDLLATL